MEYKYLPNISENIDSCRKPITAKDRIEGDIPYYGASGVVDHVRDYIFDEELLLVSEDGANLVMRSTPIAFSITGKAWVNNHAHVLRFKDKKLQVFVEYYLNHIDLSPYISGSAQPKLNQQMLNAIPVPVPSSEIIEKTVAILDRIVSIKKQRKKELLELDNLIKARFVEMFGNPVENPKGYRVDTLQALINAGDITYHLDGNHGGDYPRSEEFVSEGVPYTGANCISNGVIDFSLAKYLTVERAGKLRKGIAQDEDVLFAHNATVGPTAVLHTAEPKVILSTSLTAYRCNKKSIMPEYLATYMKSDGFVMQYSSEMKQTTRNQVPITAQKKYLFLIPPIEDQKTFAEFVKQVDKSKFVA